MTLTEEQRGALARAIDYINETDLPVGELDGFDREVLRAMIDSSDPITDVTELVELLAAGEHEQWAAWAQAILDSEPGLSEGRKAAWPGLIATPYENLSEELKDKDRREVHLRSSVALDIVQQQAAEIERLRANLGATEERVREFRSHENQTHAILGAILGTDDTLENVAKRAATRIKELESSLDEAEALTKKNAELMNGYLAMIKELEADLEQAERVIEARLEVIDQQAARIKSLKKEIRRLKHESKVEQEFTNSYIKHLHEAEARIKELKEAHKRSGAKYAKIINELRSSVYANIPGLKKQWDEVLADGKISIGNHIVGPDQMVPCWQITEERMRAIRMAEELAWDCKAVAVLRAMLQEAE